MVVGWIIALLVAAGVVGLAVAWRPLRAIFHEIHAERARELFALQRERLEAKFLDMASATGKPRGLRWKDCEWEDAVQYARERISRQLAALVSVTIRFEAIEGSDMEGLPAVANLRNATAVFYFHRGQWHTAGKTLFNMNPDEALDHFKTQYEKVELD